MFELFIMHRGERKHIVTLKNRVTAVNNAVLFLKNKFSLSELEIVDFIHVEEDKVTYNDGYINEVIFVAKLIDDEPKS